ncbi:MAG: pantoate--beta-alanine ligase [Flavobacteriaceae bacterium]|nr:pantoate--beta-alanine ligase [Flavobacteriaceae bacterium]|tara:strand:- start:63841 stop:64677 length:837 start_codon:yes stop_codon:yes gene_type:complete
MCLFHTTKEIIDFLNKTNKSIGLVPTMGALHLGHTSLIKKALIENDIVIVSVFVNPTQFDNKTDLIKYPRNIQSDIEKIKNINNKILIYNPSIKDIYNDNLYVKNFDFGFIGNELEGHFRKNHFNSVATIVEKLFNIFKPSRAYFGEKDYQQILIIKSLKIKSNLKVEIISCPTIRETDGLALSSRNYLLSEKERKIAPILYKTLLNLKNKIKNDQIESVIFKIENEFKLTPSLKLEYLEIREALSLKPVKKINKEKKYRAFISARIGKIRLIDNIEL